MNLNDLDNIVETADADIEDAAKRAKELIGGTGPGTRQAKPEEVLALMAEKVGEYPPEVWMRPDGSVVAVSPWVLQMEVIDGGKEMMATARRALGKVAGDVHSR